MEQHPLRYSTVSTLINNAADNKHIAWLDGVALWLPVGSVIELGPPRYDAEVIATRLQLFGGKAVILVDVALGDPKFIPRHPADRLLGESEH